MGRRRRRPGRPAHPRPGRAGPSQSRPRHDACAMTSACGMPASTSARISSRIRPCGSDAAGVGAGVDRPRRPPRPLGSDRARSRAARACGRRRPGTCRPPARRSSGKLSMLISVGTTAIPGAPTSSSRSSVSPLPCSIESMPAAISPGSASSPKTCAATRTPSSWTRRTASASTSSGQTGARSPTLRSIQSAAIFTQPSPRPAWRTTSSTKSSGSTSMPRSRM